MRNWWSWCPDGRPNSGGLPMGDVPGNGDGRWGGSPIGILSKPPTPKGLCSGMDMGAASSIAVVDDDGGSGDEHCSSTALHLELGEGDAAAAARD